MIASYRDPRYAASLRMDLLRERLDRLSDEIPEELIQIHTRRVARSWAGGVAILGFLGMVAFAILRPLEDQPPEREVFHPTVALAFAVVASILVYAAARLIARWSFVGRVRSSLDGESDPLARLARIESDAIRHAAIEAVHSKEKRSIALPMCGISLLLPLSMHLAVWALWESDRFELHWVTSFDWWISASLILVGVAHLVLCGVSVYFAREVARSSTLLLEHKIPVSGWAALGLTIAGACLPGVIAIAIPPVLVAVTGALFVPAMFNFMHRRAIAERRALEL
jgi:hypothetical protein